MRRASNLKEEAIPISDTITTIAGENNSGKTNFLRSVNWVYRGVSEPKAHTYNGDPTYMLTGLFSFEKGDIKRFTENKPNVRGLNRLSSLIETVDQLAKEAEDYKHLSGDVTSKRTHLDTRCIEILNALNNLEETLVQVSTKEINPCYYQITYLRENKMAIFLSPLKKFAIDTITQVLKKITDVEHIARSIVQRESPGESTKDIDIIGHFNAAKMKLEKMCVHFEFDQSIESEIENSLFRSKFIDQYKNMPMSETISLATALGKDIEKFLGGMQIRNNPSAAESALNKVVNDKIKRFGFSMIRNMTLDFHIIKDGIRISIHDTKTNRVFTMKEMSYGIRWLLSLWFQIYCEYTDMPDLLIIDEPGYNMHPGAQKDIMRILNELVSELKIQIIYTTHSPFLIDPNRILDVRLIESQYDEDTKERYSICDIKPYLCNFEPLNTALGLRFLKPYLLLEKGTDFCLVEGETDAIIIMSMSQLLFFHKQPYIDLNKYVMYPTGGANLPNVTMAVNNIRKSSYDLILILVDGDVKGEEIKKEIEKTYIPSNCKDHKILCCSIAEITGLLGSTIEDVIPTAFYLDAFIDFYKSFSHEWGNINKKDCNDFIIAEKAPVVHCLKNYISRKYKIDSNDMKFNKVGIARTLAEALHEQYGEDNKREAFFKLFVKGKELIEKLIALESRIRS